MPTRVSGESSCPCRRPSRFHSVTVPGQEYQFYGELFGWTFRPMPEYHLDYWLVDAGEGRGTIGALWPTDVAPTDSGAVVYIAVTDLRETLARAEQLGGTLVREPTDVGDGTSFVLVRDPTGTLLGLWAKGFVDA
jgi:predicted enzyme related to lactoylglutathione lyase